MSPAERAFYEWYHEHGPEGLSVKFLLRVFIAGWNARIRAASDDPLEYEPDDAEAQRIAETCVDAAREYDRAEEQL